MDNIQGDPLPFFEGEQVEYSVTTVTASKRKSVYETSTDIKDHFPFAEARDIQIQAMEGVQDTFTKTNKKFFIFEGPTGTGKSGIGIAAGSWAKTLPVTQSTRGEDCQRMPGAYLLSPQKTLTAQYMADFADMGLKELKGKSNYLCQNFTDSETGLPMNCEDAEDVFEDDHNIDSCTGYKPAKRAFMDSPLGVTNFAYWLNEQTHAGQLPQRNMLILDEGHNAENQILGFTDTVIDQRRCDEYSVAGGLPTFSAGYNEDVANWLTNEFIPAQQTWQRDIKSQLSVARDTDDKPLTVKLIRKLRASSRFMERINLFMNQEDKRDWLAWSDWDEKKKGTYKGTNNLTIKPLTATLFADDIMFSKADKIVLMSATILDFPTFMRNLGIKSSDATCLAVDSEFPLDHRPIYYKPVGNMGYKTREATLPKMAEFVGKILAKYATHKGIVHTHSYEINKYLVKALWSDYGVRIITHDNKPGSRDRAVLDHIASDRPTVLFSPSMTEGLDLKEDLSRFQVITKVPYPFLDPYVTARMERDPAWYQWLTALTLVQATGRSVRSKTDKAHTYILDSGFADFYWKNQRTTANSIELPKWWTDSIIGMTAPRWL